MAAAPSVRDSVAGTVPPTSPTEPAGTASSVCSPPATASRYTWSPVELRVTSLPSRNTAVLRPPVGTPIRPVVPAGAVRVAVKRFVSAVQDASSAPFVVTSRPRANFRSPGCGTKLQVAPPGEAGARPST